MNGIAGPGCDDRRGKLVAMLDVGCVQKSRRRPRVSRCAPARDDGPIALLAGAEFAARAPAPLGHAGLPGIFEERALGFGQAEFLQQRLRRNAERKGFIREEEAVGLVEAEPGQTREGEAQIGLHAVARLPVP